MTRFLDAGGNLVDSADRYGLGRSEEIVGRAIQGRRDQVVLATKFRFATGDGPNDSGASRRHIHAAIDASLRRLGTDWIDLYQIHCWDPYTPLEETLSTLNDLVRSGKVRYLGASNFAAWQLAKALGLAAVNQWEPFAAIQPQYSLLTRDADLDLLPLCRMDGLGVLVWGPLGGGVLTGKYQPGTEPPAGTRAGDDDPSARMLRDRINTRNGAIADQVAAVATAIGRTPAQVALNWVLHRDGISSILIGARNLRQLEQNLDAAGWALEAEQRDALSRASTPHVGYPYDVQRAFGALELD
jgi:aryl-alcohol dehydrogenase-like predicted oxidoreductase